MGHRDRAATDQYATLDKNAENETLKLMPKIEQIGKEDYAAEFRNSRRSD
ncbi:hypothetical protein ACFL4Q_05045 [candidate division KSB1 bacterium]